MLWLDKWVLEDYKTSSIYTKIKGIFLQYYSKQWSQVHNAEFAVARGLLGRYTEKLEDIMGKIKAEPVVVEADAEDEAKAA